MSHHKGKYPKKHTPIRFATKVARSRQESF